MKRIAYFGILSALVAGFAFTAAAQSDSLGDVARANRKDKKQESVKQYDDDNLPKTDKLSVVGEAPAASSDQPADVAANSGQAQADPNAKKSEDPGKVQPGDTPEDRQKVFDQWGKKISAQKTQIDAIAHELDLLQREYRLRAAAFYADAGNRLRSPGSWDKQDGQYKQQIADKQKALDAAKKQLDDMQEQARKSGVPSSVRQ